MSASSLTTRFNELDIETALQVQGLIGALASAGTLIPPQRKRKLIKHLLVQIYDLTRLGMFDRDEDNKREEEMMREAMEKCDSDDD